MICDGCQHDRMDCTAVPYGDTVTRIPERWCFIDADAEAGERDKEAE